jgi:hypothetical protein
VPEDLIGALLFLSSADSDFMTGQTIVIDGGSVMHCFQTARWPEPPLRYSIAPRWSFFAMGECDMDQLAALRLFVHVAQCKSISVRRPGARLVYYDSIQALAGP